MSKEGAQRARNLSDKITEVIKDADLHEALSAILGVLTALISGFIRPENQNSYIHHMANKMKAMLKDGRATNEDLL